MASAAQREYVPTMGDRAAALRARLTLLIWPDQPLSGEMVDAFIAEALEIGDPELCADVIGALPNRGVTRAGFGRGRGSGARGRAKAAVLRRLCSTAQRPMLGADSHHERRRGLRASWRASLNRLNARTSSSSAPLAEARFHQITGSRASSRRAASIMLPQLPMSPPTPSPR
jgi:hypothetical protein